MSILVCGGAGYIGSHVVKYLLEKNEDVVVVDNLITGHVDAVDERAHLELGDLKDEEFLNRVFEKYQIDGVIDFAAFSLVGESVGEALKYFEDEVKANDKNAVLWESLGQIYMNMFQDYDKAEKAFKKAFGLSGDGLNLYNRGIALRLLGKYEEAVEVLLQSRKISVQEGDVTDGEDLDLARCYIALKDKKNAEKYLDLAREGLENVPEEHADEFEATLEEIEDLIEKL